MKGAGSRSSASPLPQPAALALLRLTIVLLLLSFPARAGGPLKVAGVTGFNPGLAGTPLTWPEGALQYYTDQGDLSPVLPQAEANAFVADGFQRWTSVATAALSAVRAGQLDENVDGSNVILIDYGQITIPEDIQRTALAKPIAIVYDQDGKVTDALLGAGAGAADMCGSNAVYGGPDNYSADAHLAHALVVLNGNCAQNAATLPGLKYHLIRVLGQVLGLDWADLNSNVFTRKPYPIADDYLGFPVMHALDPVCPGVSPCFSAADQLKMDDRAAISRLYPVTSANLANFSGKQIFRDTTGRLHGTVYFRNRNGLPAQPMQGVKVVARWMDPATGQPSHRYAVASVSGFLFRGNAGNPATGYTDAGGERFDKFGSDDSALEGYFDLAGLEFPSGGTSAQYQVTLEPMEPACAEFSSVGPYRSGQVAPSGTTAAIILALHPGDDLTHDFVMSGSALAAADSAGTFAAPDRMAAAGYWAGSFSPYGDVDFYSFAARAERTMTVKITALNEAGKATQSKAQPVAGIWREAAAADSPPEVSATYFNSTETGATTLSAQFLVSGRFKLGIADFRGDGRPDFRYRARVFYGDSVTPTRVAAQATTSLTIRGIGLGVSTTAKINGSSAPVVAAYSDRIVLAAPSLSDGRYSIDLQAPDGAASSLLNALTYGAAAGDQIVLLQGAGNPNTPVGGEAVNPLRVRVVQADGVTPVAGALVNFSASPAGVVFARCGTTTCALRSDQQGEVSTRMSPTAAGTFTVTAAISPAADVHGTLIASASALAISAVSQSSWLAEGATTSVPLAVRVLANGQPVAGRSVQYAITQGRGNLSSTTAATNAAGYANVNLGLESLAAEVHASACVLPDVKPCSNFYIYMLPVGSLRLQPVAGDQQIINTSQAFSPVQLRVIDSATPSHAVQGAPITVLTAVLRWQPPAANLARPPAPVVLASSQRALYSDSAGLVSVPVAADVRFGAVLVNMIAYAEASYPLQLELQRLWAPPGWVSSAKGAEAGSASYQRPRRRVTSSPRNPPTD